MNDDKVLCSECFTENESKYEYCKNCGAKLKKQPENPVNNSFSQNSFQNTQPNFVVAGFDCNTAAGANVQGDPQQGYAQPLYQQGFPFQPGYNGMINGIPSGEIATFIGKKAYNYLPVFSRQEITSSKIAWHWPCAVLSFLFGPFGAAIWFFFRKMYKHALIFSGIGFVLAIIVSAVLGDFEGSDDILELYESILNGNIPLRYLISSLVSNLMNISFAVICGLFTHNWYKNHICRKILKYRSYNVNMQYYQMGLMSMGGTSGGMLTLGIFVMIAAENISSLISNLILSLF